jgi:hypothetical protein
MRCIRRAKKISDRKKCVEVELLFLDIHLGSFTLSQISLWAQCMGMRFDGGV